MQHNLEDVSPTADHRPGRRFWYPKRTTSHSEGALLLDGQLELSGSEQRFGGSMARSAVNWASAGREINMTGQGEKGQADVLPTLAGNKLVEHAYNLRIIRRISTLKIKYPIVPSNI